MENLKGLLFCVSRIKSTHTDKNDQILTPASFVSLLEGKNQLADKSYLTLLAAIVPFRMLKLTHVDQGIQDFTPKVSHLLGDIDSLSPCHCVCPIMFLSFLLLR